MCCSYSQTAATPSRGLLQSPPQHAQPVTRAERTRVGRPRPVSSLQDSGFLLSAGVNGWASNASLSCHLKIQREMALRESWETRQRDGWCEVVPSREEWEKRFSKRRAAQNSAESLMGRGLGDRPLLQPSALCLRPVCEQFMERQATQVMSSEVGPRSRWPRHPRRIWVAWKVRPPDTEA